MTKDKAIRVSFSVPAEMYEKFKEACQVKMACASKVVAKLLNDFIKKSEEGKEDVV